MTQRAITILPPAMEDTSEAIEDTQPLSRPEMAEALYQSAYEAARGDEKAIAQANLHLRRMVGEAVAFQIITHNLAVRQFKLIVEGLEIEYRGEPNWRVNLFSDKRFSSAKQNLENVVGDTRAQNELHQLLTP